MSGNVVPSADIAERGGKIKVSQILGTVGAGAGAIGALAPITAPVAIPLGILAGLGSSIASLFGGNLSMEELKMVAMIKHRVSLRQQMVRNDVV